jgi:membrane dipeptidase
LTSTNEPSLHRSDTTGVGPDWRDFPGYAEVAAAQDRERRISDRARQLVAQSLVIDMTLPFGEGNVTTHGALERARGTGVDFISVTVNDLDAFPASTGVLRTVARLQRYVAANADRFGYARDLADVADARSAGLTAVGIHLQDSEPLEGDLDRLRTYRILGVSHILLAYNTGNRIAGGCADTVDGGLSRLGRSAVTEMRAVGILCDGSHSGRRSTLQAMELYDGPFIFSHSNCAAVVDHYRNLTDEQIRSCAATDGVIGLNGCGEFLADPMATASSLFEHLDYLCDMVGPRHVGLGLDRIVDAEASHEAVLANQSRWPTAGSAPLPFYNFAAPETVLELVDEMLDHGYDEAAIRAVLGGNWQRVLSEVWV